MLRVPTETASSSLLAQKKTGIFKAQVLLLQELHRGKETAASTMYITH